MDLNKAFQKRDTDLRKKREERRKAKVKFAIELAVLLLGDEAKKPVVEEQAKEFMLMKIEHLSSSIKRWHGVATHSLNVEKRLEEARENSINGYVSDFGARLLDLGDD
jgi:hypothetical protein